MRKADKQASELHVKRMLTDFGPVAAMAVGLGVDRESFLAAAAAAYDWWARIGSESDEAGE